VTTPALPSAGLRVRCRRTGTSRSPSPKTAPRRWLLNDYGLYDKRVGADRRSVTELTVSTLDIYQERAIVAMGAPPIYDVTAIAYHRREREKANTKLQ